MSIKKQLCVQHLFKLDMWGMCVCARVCVLYLRLGMEGVAGQDWRMPRSWPAAAGRAAGTWPWLCSGTGRVHISWDQTHANAGSRRRGDATPDGKEEGSGPTYSVTCWPMTVLFCCPENTRHTRGFLSQRASAFRFYEPSWKKKEVPVDNMKLCLSDQCGSRIRVM